MTSRGPILSGGAPGLPGGSGHSPSRGAVAPGWRRYWDVDDRTTARMLLLAWVILFGITAGPVVTAFVVTPEAIESGAVVLSPPCPYKKATGHDCPSCGLSRGFSALAHGRWTDARRYHTATPVVFVVFVVVAGWAARLGVRDARRAFGG